MLKQTAVLRIVGLHAHGELGVLKRGDLVAEIHIGSGGEVIPIAVALGLRDAANKWEEVHAAMGMAVFDPRLDAYVIDTVRRADKSMYADKRARKNAVR